MAGFRVEGVGARPDDDAFDRQRQISWWNQERVEQAKVLVVGAGAVGNEVLKNLVLLGVGYILVLDFDSISTSNLSRTVLFRRGDENKNKAAIAAQRALELRLNPATTIEYENADVGWDIGHGVFSRVDLVLGCVDNAEARRAVNHACFKAGKPWIDAGIDELACHIAVYQPGASACYECNITTAQLENALRRYSCDAVRRTFVAEGRTPTVQVAAALVGALQTQEALKLLCGHSVSSGAKLFFQGTVNSLDSFVLRPNPDCPLHGPTATVTRSPHRRTTTVGDFLRWSHDVFNEPCTIDLTGLRWSFIHSVACGRCGTRTVVDGPNYRIAETDCFCASCDAIDSREYPLAPEYVSDLSFDASPGLLGQTFATLGFPRGGVVRLRRRSGGTEAVELTADIGDAFPTLGALAQQD